MPNLPDRASVPAPIPYQGSKRRLAPAILSLVPPGTTRVHEPFCGSAAVSLAALAGGRVDRVVLNDLDRALVTLWGAVIRAPAALAAGYQRLWEAQHGRPRAFYDECRTEFNATGRPELFLFLLSRCAKAAVRYNARGEFNQAPDNRRAGARPERVAQRLEAAAALLGGRCALASGDYRDALAAVGVEEVVYLDPPYQGVSGRRDRRYGRALDFATFVASLGACNARGLSYLVSFDGRTGERAHGRPLPAELGLVRVEVDAGRSAQATLLGRAERTVESLYVSPALARRLGGRRGVARRLATSGVTARLVGEGDP